MKFQDLKELTIDGFEYQLSEIFNKNIISLNINILNEFSLNRIHLSSINNYDLSHFKSLENLKISGDNETLLEITYKIQKNNLKNITFYLRDKNNNNIEKIVKKLQKKNINLKVLPT